jgi:hypothetical protein
MKLYANVSSERASKGQGGNDYINIELSRQNNIPFCDMRYFIDKKSGEYVLMVDDYEIKRLEGNFKLKGKRQKGKREGICHCGYPCIYGTDYCERHQIP